eukprot:TRINITY_DN554_c0_g1_i1.p1 TRINITY_DN554_c0_g1~~TRINITY_DN554_c0_g1_i1.p1  ORF type:complete len:100 (-),score=5.55 TRINITY_DN554_c0_g1_i1:628-927(-)
MHGLSWLSWWFCCSEPAPDSVSLPSDAGQPAPVIRAICCCLFKSPPSSCFLDESVPSKFDRDVARLNEYDAQHDQDSDYTGSTPPDSDDENTPMIPSFP